MNNLVEQKHFIRDRLSSSESQPTSTFSFSEAVCLIAPVHNTAALCTLSISCASFNEQFENKTEPYSSKG